MRRRACRKLPELLPLHSDAAQSSAHSVPEQEQALQERAGSQCPGAQKAAALRKAARAWPPSGSQSDPPKQPEQKMQVQVKPDAVRHQARAQLKAADCL